METKLLILDLDGVLIDSKEIHFLALNKALRLVNSNFVISEPDHLAIYDGLPTRKKLELISKFKKLKKSDHEFIWQQKQKFTTILFDKIKENKNLKKNLLKLKRKNIKIALASNAINQTVNKVLNKLKIKKLFDTIMSSDDVSLPKPYPEIYWKIMTNLSALPTNTVIVEDSPIGRQAAKHSMCKLIEVQKPKDLDNLFFQKIIMFFENNIGNRSSSVKWVDKKLNVLVPMAGAGDRFTKAGYTFPKPLIEINGMPMIEYVVRNLNIDANWIFIVQKKHYDKYFLKTLLNNISENCKIVISDKLTEGAACTSLLAKDLINNNQSLLIANSDQIIEWSSDKFMYFFQNSKADGGILTFDSSHPKWSYAKLDNLNMVEEVAEKNLISRNATCGIYFWKKGSDYVKYAERMINNNSRINNEFYICPVYNEAIKDKKKIIIKKVKKMQGIGTPEDLQKYLNQKHK